MKTDFLAGGNFLRHVLPVEEVYSLTGTYFSVSPSLASGNEFCVHCKQYFFLIPIFFLLVKTIIEIWGKSIFKDKPFSCQWTPFLFNFFIDFESGSNFYVQWERIFQQIHHPASGNGFPVQWKCFLTRAISVSGNYYCNQGKTVFK